eukprot:1261422-Amphidinium_carterae.2
MEVDANAPSSHAEATVTNATNEHPRKRMKRMPGTNQQGSRDGDQLGRMDAMDDWAQPMEELEAVLPTAESTEARPS